jgi:hypothetical protein
VAAVRAELLSWQLSHPPLVAAAESAAEADTAVIEEGKGKLQGSSGRAEVEQLQQHQHQLPMASSDLAVLAVPAGGADGAPAIKVASD